MQSIEAAIQALFTEHVEVACAVPALVNDQLFPEERRSVARAVPKRQAEFGMSRVCARRALFKLGVPPGPIAPNEDGSPRWPAGVVGSISHTDRFCAVAVGWSARLRSIGIDLEPSTPLESEVESLICTASEICWLNGQPGGQRGLAAKVIFCAKEALYKCQYPLTGVYLDFQDVEITVRRDVESFSARIINGADETLGIVPEICCRLRCTDDLVIAACELLSAGRRIGYRHARQGKADEHALP